MGTGVTGGRVAVATGVGLGCASVGAGVRGAGVIEADGDELGEVDADGEGLAEGVATCCEAITAAPSRSNATSATAAKTVNTVDHRSAWRRIGRPAAGGATFTPAGGRSSWAVASGSAGGGGVFSRMRARDRTSRAERSDARPVGRYAGCRTFASWLPRTARPTMRMTARTITPTR